MNILLVTLGVMLGLLICIPAYYILKHFKYIEVNKYVNFIINNIFIALGVIDMFIIIIALMLLLLGISISVIFTTGIIIGTIISILFICYCLFSAKGRYIHILHKIEKIKTNLSLLEYDKTDKQEQAVRLLKKTQQKLKEQAYDILIMNSIKVAKNIELSNKYIDIQRELDELEALQILNKK